jgi:peroxiredoxin
MKLRYRFTRCLFVLTAYLALFAGKAAAQAGPAATPVPHTVYIFLSETCPISQFYTLTLKELYREFATKDLQFTGIFPNTASTPQSIAEFKNTYNLPFPLQTDPGQHLTKTLKATITPEVVVKNETTGAIVYKGRIDDSYFRVGKRRSVSREHDLENALTELKNNRPVSKPEAPAVGCYITVLP